MKLAEVKTGTDNLGRSFQYREQTEESKALSLEQIQELLIEDFFENYCKIDTGEIIQLWGERNIILKADEDALFKRLWTYFKGNITMHTTLRAANRAAGNIINKKRVRTLKRMDTPTFDFIQDAINIGACVPVYQNDIEVLPYDTPIDIFGNKTIADIAKETIHLCEEALGEEGALQYYQFILDAIHNPTSDANVHLFIGSRLNDKSGQILCERIPKILGGVCTRRLELFELNDQRPCVFNRISQELQECVFMVSDKFGTLDNKLNLIRHIRKYCQHSPKYTRIIFSSAFDLYEELPDLNWMILNTNKIGTEGSILTLTEIERAIKILWYESIEEQSLFLPVLQTFRKVFLEQMEQELQKRHLDAVPIVTNISKAVNKTEEDWFRVIIEDTLRENPNGLTRRELYHRVIKYYTNSSCGCVITEQDIRDKIKSLTTITYKTINGTRLLMYKPSTGGQK